MLDLGLVEDQVSKHTFKGNFCKESEHKEIWENALSLHLKTSGVQMIPLGVLIHVHLLNG